MKFIVKSNILMALLVISGVIFFTACERDYNTIGVDIVDNGASDVHKATFNVKAYNRKLSGVRTDGLTGYQLADYKHPVFGGLTSSFASQLSLGNNSNPTFGDNTQTEENASADDQENETVTAVYLNIPYYSTLLSDTISDESPNQREYRVDSVFGNRDATFTLTVNEYTKFLRELDPDSNFQEAQAYYSNEDPSAFISTVLYEGDTIVNEEELLFFNNDDDPDTEDEDESEIPSERLTPRIRVPLNTQFFQEKILDNEGQSVLQSNNNFKDFLRGIYVSMESPNDELAMLLNVPDSYIEIEYEYASTNDDGEAVTKDDTFRLSMASGSANKVNYFQQEAYPQEIADQFSNNDASRLYIQGGAGSFVEIDITDGAGDVLSAFQQAKENGWLINEANLVFYVDESSIDQESDLTLPPRIYLYDYKNQRQLIDYSIDLTQSTGVDSTSYTIFDGRLDTDNDVGPRYRFRITNYMNSLIRNDSLNVKLGLTTTNSILNVANVSAFLASNDSLIKTPQAAIPNFYGTVFYGNNVPENEGDKKLKLEIYYTEPK